MGWLRLPLDRLHVPQQTPEPRTEPWIQEEVDEAVKSFVADAYRVDASTLLPTTDFNLVLHDDLVIVEVIMACEECFALEFKDKEAEHCATIGDLTNYIVQRLGIA